MTFALVDLQNSRVVREFNSFPDPIVWPNGDATHAAIVGDERDGFRIMEVVRGPLSPGEFYKLASMEMVIDGPTLRYNCVWEGEDIGRVKSLLRDRVDSLAEAERLKYVTPGWGQSLVYLSKAAEAAAFIADNAPSPENYPLLVGSSLGRSLAETATEILAREAQWKQIGGGIEATRLSVKASIGASNTIEEALAAVGQLAWPS